MLGIESLEAFLPLFQDPGEVYTSISRFPGILSLGERVGGLAMGIGLCPGNKGREEAGRR